MVLHPETEGYFSSYVVKRSGTRIQIQGYLTPQNHAFNPCVHYLPVTATHTHQNLARWDPKGEKGLAPRERLDGPMPPSQIGWGPRPGLPAEFVPMGTRSSSPAPQTSSLQVCPCPAVHH